MNPFQTRKLDFPKLTRDQARAMFGPVSYEKQKWAKASTWCSSLEVPTGLDDWVNTATGLIVKKIYVNEQMHAPLSRALGAVVARGLAGELKSFDGCYSVRPVRGGREWSWHAYALAIDLNASDNPLGGPSRLSQGLVDAFTEQGFLWGGDFISRPDPQHFQWGIG